MHCTKGIRVARRLINLTDKTIQVYDKPSGNIITIHPESHMLPFKPLEKDLTNKTYYIFSKKVANRLKKSGRPLHDIAIVKSRSRGRSNSEITTLVWGEKISEEIGLYIIQNTLSEEARRGA